MRKKEDFAKGHIKKPSLIQFDEEKLGIPVFADSFDKQDEKQSKNGYCTCSHVVSVFFLIGV